MNIIETATVLAKIQAFDNRNVGDETTMAWQEILDPHLVQDALEAVTDYFKANTGWIMPADIVVRVREREQARARQFTNGYRLSLADDERMLSDGEWRTGMELLGRAVRTGALTPEAYEVYQAGSQPIEEFLNRKAVAQ